MKTILWGELLQIRWRLRSVSGLLFPHLRPVRRCRTSLFHFSPLQRRQAASRSAPLVDNTAAVSGSRKLPQHSAARWREQREESEPASEPTNERTTSSINAHKKSSELKQQFARPAVPHFSFFFAPSPSSGQRTGLRWPAARPARLCRPPERENCRFHLISAAQ